MSWNLAIDRVRRAPMVRWITQVWLLILIAGSLQPKRPGTVLTFHREIHWLAFAGAAFLLLLPARTLGQAVRRACGLLLLALLLEIGQHFLYHRPAEWLDVRDDASAILAAAVIYGWAVRPNATAVDRS